MTFEEIQRTIEGMLAIQRDTQEKQVANTEAIARIAEKQEKLTEKLDNVSSEFGIRSSELCFS